MNGGWIPVIKRRVVGNQDGYCKKTEVITIFVDNIPESMDAKGLFNLFRKFGVVKDAFIPGKRRRVLGSRFGFVQYDCEVAAEMAIEKADGLWCDNKALKVKRAEFQKPHALEALVRRRVRDSEKVVIRAYEEGNGWLYESLVVKLSSFLTVEAFKAELHNRGMRDVIVRDNGGRIVVLTFNSVQQMKEGKEQIGKWVLLEFKGKSIPVRICEELSKCLLPTSSESRVKEMLQLKSKGCETVEVDQLSGNGGTTRCDYRGTVAREKEVVSEDDEVSRVQETVAGRSDVIRRDYDGKYAPTEAMVSMGNDKVGAGSKEEGMNQGVNSQ
ncbi:hypothetical protein ACSBR2_008864 [Camellia fascicularis]